MRIIIQLSTRLQQANVIRKMNKQTKACKLPIHFANAVYVVYDEGMGQVLDYNKLINHNKGETRK